MEGDGQVISVNTIPAGASCTFTRDGEVIGSITNTPGSLAVNKSRKTILVSCEKPGYQTIVGSDISRPDGAIFGNILIGGLIGLLVDLGTAADHNYGGTITVTFPPPERSLSSGTVIPRS